MTRFQVVVFILTGVVVAVWMAAWFIGLFVDRSVLESAKSLNGPGATSLGILGGNQLAGVLLDFVKAKLDVEKP